MKLLFRFALLLAVAVLMSISEGRAYRAMDFMETFELRDLTYVGMGSYGCGSRRDNYAVVLDAEGLRHSVRLGEYIGKNFGAVKQITPTYLLVEEVFENQAREWISRDVTLPKIERQGARARFNYEEDHALALLGQCSSAGKELEKRLLECRALYGMDAERLAFFDRAVASRF